MTSVRYPADAPNVVVDSTTTFAAAANIVNTEGGGVIHIPAGVHYTTGVTITADNVTLQGDGAATRIINTTASQDIITLQNNDWCVVRDLFLDGSWVGGRGLVLEGCRWSQFSNITGDRFNGPMVDLRADGAATRNVNNNTFSHIHAENCTGFIRLKGKSGQFVTLNQFSNTSAVGAGSVASVLIDFDSYCDTNLFLGMTRLSCVFGTGDKAVVMNSDAPTSIRDVYGNHFVGELAVDLDASGAVALEVNDTRESSSSGPWPSRISNLRVGGTNPSAPVVNTNGYVVQSEVYGSFSDTDRPTASDFLPGTMIWNTTDGAPNWSDGTNWVDATGATT